MSTGAEAAGRSRRQKAVLLRVALLVASYVVGGGLVWLLFSAPLESSTAISSGTGRATTVTQSSSTLYQSAPGTVHLLLGGLAAALVVATASVIWRIARRSTRLGVTAVIVGGLVGAVALLGILTIGMFVMPLAVLLVLAALPIAPERAVPSAPVGHPPPGWYWDPAGAGSWRYWDGWVWTGHVAAMGTGA